jgi:MFS transporter, AAHS family, 4-hydroxybenzoate transporter
MPVAEEINVADARLRFRWPTEQLFFCATILLAAVGVAMMMFHRFGLSAGQDAREELDTCGPEALVGGAR